MSTEHEMSSSLLQGDPKSSFRLYRNGDEYFPALFKEIGLAKSVVVVEAYILHNDEIGRGFARTLIEAAKRGVRVILVVDGFGSLSLSHRFVRELEASGVRVLVYNPPFSTLLSWLRIFRRNHRKLVSVDGKLVFLGGMNITTDHMLSKKQNTKWDYAVSVGGDPALRSLESSLRLISRLQRNWRMVLANLLQSAASWVRRGTKSEGFALWLNARSIRRRHLRLLKAAKNEVLIVNPYFLPDHGVIRQVRAAAARGVRVRILTQGVPEFPWVKYASRALYRHFLAKGIEVWEFEGGLLHAKLMICDGRHSLLGSYNFDPLSNHFNLESNIEILNKDAVIELSKDVELNLFKQSRLVCDKEFRARSLWVSVRDRACLSLIRILSWVLRPR